MFGRWKAFVRNEEHPLQERLFVLIIGITAMALAVVLLANTVNGAGLADILIIAAGLALLGLIAVVSIRKNRIKIGANVISALVVFALLPFSFFSGGGIYGGPPIWFVFFALFVSLILTGRNRLFFLISDIVVAGLCYVVAYTRPESIHPNTTLVAYIDSFSALVFISLATSAMVSFALWLYRKESSRSEQQKQEIEALNEAQNRFFSSMSHEIRTPINTIIGFNEMILRGDVSDEVAEDAANIQAAGKMLLHLINDILDMSKLESGNMKLSCAPYRIDGMLSELVNMFWSRAREKGLDFHVSVSPEVPAELIGDDVRIRQILINVLNNAVKYTNEGSVTLSIQCGARSGERLDMIYTVSDTGIGIKKESIPYLFNAFKRVDEDKTRHIEGTGLGLSIVKQLVELMDGSITVNSAYTQGSTFVIQIPQTVVGEEQVGELDLESRHKNARTAYRSRFEAPEARVLIVDDNASNRLVVRKLLRETGVQVDCASSGEEALRMTLEKAYHVIFMDHLMPGMDGLECHRRILAQTGGRCRDSKIVALTANADSESRALYEKEGFDGCLTKPVDGAALERELSLQLPPELVHSLGEDDGDLLSESMAWIKAPQQKRLVAIAAESTADLPKKQMERYGIAAIPHLVLTEQGVFRDGLDLETDGLLAYMADSKHKVRATPPDAAAHERFFAGQLAGARDLVYVTLSQKIGNSAFPFAKEAAASFNNVTVLDSGHLSSGYGLQVLEAARMAEQGKTPAEIAKRLEETKELVQTSFIVDGLEYLARAGQVRTGTALLTKALSVRPVLSVKNGKLGVERVIFGSKRRAWRRYIELCLRTPAAVDERELFITHTGLSQQELRWIRGQVEARVRFDTVCCQKTSPSTAVNCGPGTFGLLFRKKES